MNDLKELQKIKEIIKTTQKHIENQAIKKQRQTEKLKNNKKYDFEELYTSTNTHYLFSEHTEKVITKILETTTKEPQNKETEEIQTTLETIKERLKLVNKILKQQKNALEQKNTEEYLDLYEQEKIIDEGTINNYEPKLTKYKIKIPRKTILKTTLTILLLISAITNTNAQTPQINQTKIENIKETTARKAILIVDMQEHYLNELNKKELQKELQNQIKIIKEAVKQNIPIITLKMAGKGETIKEIKNTIPNTKNNKEIKKYDSNGFNVRELNHTLNKLGVTEIIIMGTNASSCVLWTSVGAIEHKYKITTTKEIILDSPEWHNANKEQNLEAERLDFYKKYTNYKENTNQIIEQLRQPNTDPDKKYLSKEI
ncbi:isochorismatase family protein [Candidatus Woesearchaeota archaeon]|nr:isochorismatase family protein [Candidatus Woesearchaeota archaeon]